MDWSVYTIVQICTFMYTSSMSKGITKIQLALAEKKGRRVELVILKGLLRCERDITTVTDRIKELDLEILDIEGRIPRERI